MLLTAFEPFAGRSINPSAEALDALSREPPSGMTLHAVLLPVVYASAWPALLAGIETGAPDLVLATGVGGGPGGLAVERVAANLDDCEQPDNAGETRQGRPIVDTGQASYVATLPVDNIVEAARAAGVAAHPSGSAGAFLCNHVFYRLSHYGATLRPGARFGFVHVPWPVPRGSNEPGCLTARSTVSGLRAILASLRK